MRVLRGALAGGIATWLMDLVTTGLLTDQSTSVTERERAARPNGRGPVENLVDRIERQLDLSIDDRQRSVLVQAIHFGLGIVPGASYATLRCHLPLLGAARGAVYGALLWVVMDEYFNTALGLAGVFDAYPLETHWRGLVGHVVLGVATDTVIDVLGG